jgi:hypothetical protein
MALFPLAARRHRTRSAALPRLAVTAVAVVGAALSGVALHSFVSIKVPHLRQVHRVTRRVEEVAAPEVAAPTPPPVMQEEGKCYGHCLQPDGQWLINPEGIPIEGSDDEAAADKVWAAFKKQYSSAAERGMYMDTPVGEQDVKYRARRLKQTFGTSHEEVLRLVEMEALPLVVDSDYVKKTFDAMVRGADREKALSIIYKNPGVLTAGDSIEENMGMAEVAAGFIDATRPLNSLLQGVLGKR